MPAPMRLRCDLFEDRLAPTTLPTGFQESLVAGGLGNTTAMTVAADGRVFVAVQDGDLRVVKNGALLPTPFLHVNVDSSGERGLLGVAFDPNFASNQFVYVYYTVPGAGVHNRVSRITASGDVAAAGSEKVILEIDPLSTASNHNGGAIHFGADGMLYVAVGENANPAHAQTLNNLLGKILRLDVSQITAADPVNSPKLVPADNPFVTQATGINRVIYALGYRNPFTFAVQPGTGTIFVNDVGQSTFEEIDRLEAGGNYGWNKAEGFAATVPPAGLGPGTHRDPLLAYPHQGGPAGGGVAVVGGAFYNPAGGALTPFPSDFVGKYFYADLGGNWIRVFDPTAPGSRANPDTSAKFADDTVANPVDLALAPDGGLFYLARGAGGQLLKISFTAGGGTLPGTPVLAAGAGAGGAPRVALFDPETRARVGEVLAYEAAFTGGVRVAQGDVDGDGVRDLITGPGPGGGPVLKVFDGKTGALRSSSLAFEATFTGGLFVASADFNRDGFAELVVSPDETGGPRVRVLDGKTSAVLADFFGIEDPNFRGGARVAAGDLNGDGVPDLLVGAGFGGGPRIAAFNGKSVAAGQPVKLFADFFVFEQTLRNGVFLTAGDLDGDGFADLIAGGGPGGGPRVFGLGGRQLTGATFAQVQVANFFAGDSNLRGGVHVAAVQIDADARADLMNAAVGAGSLVRVYSGAKIPANGDVQPEQEFAAFDDPLPGGVFVG